MSDSRHSDRHLTGHLTDEELALIAAHTPGSQAQGTDSAVDAEGGDGDVATGVDTGALEHLAYCLRCRQQVARTERVMRALVEPVAVEKPPADVWGRIAATLDGPSGNPRATDGDVAGGAAVVDLGEGRGSIRSAPTGLIDASDAEPGPRRRWTWVVAAAAAGVVAGAAAAALIAGLSGAPETEDATGESPGDQDAVAVGGAVLDPVAEGGPGGDLSGQAEMVREPDGRLRLTVQVSQPATDGYYEVWLRNEEANQLISLGTVTATTTSLPVPEDIDLEQFPVVDVSQEHFDGDPSHSGVTLAAGAMQSAEQ